MARRDRQRMHELSLWCRQLGMMLRTGTDLVAALSVLERQDFSPELRSMTTEMVEQADEEVGVEGLIACRADVFPPVAVFALRAGQGRHRVPETLITLADCFAQAGDIGMTLSLGEPAAGEDGLTTLNQAPTVRIVDSILRQASKAGATEVDVRADDDEQHTRVTYTIDGSTHTAADLPLDSLGPICRRICVMAGINWHLKQPALGTLQVGEREGDPGGSVRFLPGEREADFQVHVNLTDASGEAQ